MPDTPRRDAPTRQEANPTRRQGADHDRREEELRSFDAGPEPVARGAPANVDLNDFEDGDGAQLDWGEPEPDAVHSQTHAARPLKAEAERAQGPKTRQRNKQIVSGKPYG